MPTPNSYYAEIQLPSTYGTVSAFYVYKTDSNEVDMEVSTVARVTLTSIGFTKPPWHCFSIAVQQPSWITE